jgi:hypothetical protein
MAVHINYGTAPAATASAATPCSLRRDGSADVGPGTGLQTDAADQPRA